MIYKKRYSQIFLNNRKIALKIISYLKYINIKTNCILEIGSGLGILSKELIKITNNCIFVEIDKDLILKLRKKINKNFLILNKNILNIKLSKIKQFNTFYIIGNFPYNISSKIIIWLINNSKYIKKCIGTFQKEFANNLFYEKKFKSKLSVITNMIYNIKKKININRKNFYPIPKVESIVIIFKKKKKKYNINYKKFYNFIKEIFKYKRKIIKNSLKLYFLKKHIFKNNKIFYKRPEDLSIKEYIALYKKYN